VAFYREVSVFGDIGSTETQQVRYDEPMSGRQERNEVAPEVAAGWEAVYEYDRFARSARSGSVVVESVVADLDELSSHQPPGWKKRSDICAHDVVATRLASVLWR